jgi:hypothetical protein
MQPASQSAITFPVGASGSPARSTQCFRKSAILNRKAAANPSSVAGQRPATGVTWEPVSSRNQSNWAMWGSPRNQASALMRRSIGE